MNYMLQQHKLEDLSSDEVYEFLISSALRFCEMESSSQDTTSGMLEQN